MYATRVDNLVVVLLFYWDFISSLLFALFTLLAVLFVFEMHTLKLFNINWICEYV